MHEFSTRALFNALTIRVPVSIGTLGAEHLQAHAGHRCNGTLVPSQRPPHTRAWLILSHLRAVIFQSDGERKSALPQ